VPWIGAVGGLLGAGGIGGGEPLMRKSYGFRAAVRKRVRLVVRLRLGYESSAGESRDGAVVVHCCLYIQYCSATLVGAGAVFVCCLPLVPFLAPTEALRPRRIWQCGVATWSRNVGFSKCARNSTCSPLILHPHASAEAGLYSRKQ